MIWLAFYSTQCSSQNMLRLLYLWTVCVNQVKITHIYNSTLWMRWDGFLHSEVHVFLAKCLVLHSVETRNVKGVQWVFRSLLSSFFQTHLSFTSPVIRCIHKDTYNSDLKSAGRESEKPMKYNVKKILSWYGTPPPPYFFNVDCKS